jgi:hypothetical protein
LSFFLKKIREDLYQAHAVSGVVTNQSATQVAKEIIEKHLLNHKKEGRILAAGLFHGESKILRYVDGSTVKYYDYARIWWGDNYDW